MRGFRQNAGEFCSSIVVAVLGAGIVAAVPSQAGSPDSVGLGPRPMPYALGTGLLVLGLSLARDALKRPPPETTADAVPPRPRLWAPWAAIAAIVAHVLVFGLVGYRLATMALLLVLALLYGLRRGWTFWALVVLAPLAIFVLVERGLVILLPRGILGW